MTTLKKAKEQGKLEDFIAEHEKDAPGDAKTHGGKLRQFLSLETIKPHINNDLAMAIDSPQKFVRPGRGGLPINA